MPPESSAQAYIDVGAKTMFPIHWGIFDLRCHARDAPIERVTKACRERGVDLVTPSWGRRW